EPLPFSHPDRIVEVYQNDRAKGIERAAVAPGNFVEWRARTSAFSAIGVAEPFGLQYSTAEGPEEIPNFNVTRDFFAVLDVKPLLGRSFDDDDYQPHHQLSL